MEIKRRVLLWRRSTDWCSTVRAGNRCWIILWHEVQPRRNRRHSFCASSSGHVELQQRIRRNLKGNW